MSKSLIDALGNGSWSVSSVIFDLNDIVDAEGRPISERRSDAKVRAGVEMEMRLCPYGGIRHNHWMNVSALEQVARYYNSVFDEIVAFRRQTLGVTPTWADILACVVDQLARPAIYLLQQRDAEVPVPAMLAVSHKLGAGLFGVMRSLHERLALGSHLPLTAATFLDLVDETGALLGASEACAGSPKMIRNIGTALVEGGVDSGVRIDSLRLELARRLALQVQIGIFWHLYDRAHLWSLLRGDFRKQLIPSTGFLARKLELAANELDVSAPHEPVGDALPDILNAQFRQRITDVLCDCVEPQALEEDLRMASMLLSQTGSVIRHDGDVALFALRVAYYLHTRRLIAAELTRLELELREILGFLRDAPISLGAAVFPTPRALSWYELILGRRLGADGHLTGSTTGVRLDPSG